MVIASAILVTVLVALASYVALMNLAGAYLAIQRKRKGISGGYSSVPIVSLMLCLMAVTIAYDKVGFWPLIPALIDPGTWSVVILPCFLMRTAFKKD